VVDWLVVGAHVAVYVTHGQLALIDRHAQTGIRTGAAAGGMKPGSAGRVIWSLTMQGGLASLAVTDPGHLLQVVKRSLKTVQCEPDLTGGCLAGTGLLVAACWRLLTQCNKSVNLLFSVDFRTDAACPGEKG
jgi:hypothetical protein